MEPQTQGKLIICPTPLGNLGDMTSRALDALKGASAVCAEDTRVTGKLLSAFHIEKRLERLDEATIGKRAEEIVERIAAGEVIVYCSDAGMPGVSDPGLRLVRTAHEAGVPVEVLPGGTAVATAYVASGTINPRFYFGGFFPRKKTERLSLLESLRALDAALIFYESPNRIVSALEAVKDIFPRRDVAVCRELTKLHEEILRGSVFQVYETLKEREEQGALKGEIVLVIDSASASEEAEVAEGMLDSAEQRAALLVAEGKSNKDIVHELRTTYKLSRNAAYELVLRISGR